MNSSSKTKDMGVQELLTLIQNKDMKDTYTLIDVREKHERINGVIPTSIWIPLGEIEHIFNLDDQEFLDTFKFPKFQKEDSIIFHCHVGGRSSKAEAIANSLGYLNTINYRNGWSEFSVKYPELICQDEKLRKLLK